jgi:hypothetical protein
MGRDVLSLLRTSCRQRKVGVSVVRNKAWLVMSSRWYIVVSVFTTQCVKEIRMTNDSRRQGPVDLLTDSLNLARRIFYSSKASLNILKFDQSCSLLTRRRCIKAVTAEGKLEQNPQISYIFGSECVL